MSRKKQPIYPPLDFLKKLSARYPGIWDEVEHFRALNGSSPNLAWAPWCYIPTIASLSLLRQISGINGDLSQLPRNQIEVIASVAFYFSALAPWRQSKEVYVMDEAMQELLFDQAGDLALDAGILLHLPYPCFYIQFSPAVVFAGEEYHGVFVSLDDNFVEHQQLLTLLYLQPDGEATMIVPVHLEAKTISESMAITERLIMRTSQDKAPAVAHQFDLLRRTMQLVLYICAQNAEITPSPEQASHTKRSLAGKIVDRYAEIRKWDVGIRAGNAVRNYRKQQEATAPVDRLNTHASPRPHMRRGHWHHFWTGPKSKPAERKLILQWVAPTFVTSAGKDDTPVVLHRVDLPDTGDQPPKV